MLIDDVLPRYDVSEYHELAVAAPPARTYAAIWETDFAVSVVIKALLALRSLPTRVAAPTAAPETFGRLRLGDILQHGFCLLGETPGREVVLGVAGRFWRATGNLLPSDPGQFREPVPAGTARAVWNFAVGERPDRTSLLTTETRVLCADDQARRRFRRYWRVVGPFSALIRRRMLDAVRRSACGNTDRLRASASER